MKTIDQINSDILSYFNLGNNSYDKLLQQKEKELLKIYKSSLNDTKALIEKFFANYTGDITYQDAQKYNRLLNLEKSIAEQIKKLSGETIKLSTNAIKQSFEDAYLHTGYAMETGIGINLYFGDVNLKAVDNAILNPMDRITWIDREKEWGKVLNNHIREQITQGIIQGKGYIAIAQSIKEEYEKNADRIIRVVRTETHRAQSMGRLQGFERTFEAAKELGIDAVEVWDATLDNRTRVDHQRMDKERKQEDGLYHLKSEDGNEYTAPAPGMFGIAKEDINCRCISTVEIDGIEPKSRVARDELGRREIVPNMSYKQWQEWKKTGKLPEKGTK